MIKQLTKKKERKVPPIVASPAPKWKYKEAILLPPYCGQLAGSLQMLRGAVLFEPEKSQSHLPSSCLELLSTPSSSF